MVCPLTRSNAMARARELRAKVKDDSRLDLDSSGTNAVLARQRRRRQLDATKKLLDNLSFGEEKEAESEVAAESYGIVSSNQLKMIHNLSSTAAHEEKENEREREDDCHLHPPNDVASSQALSDPASHIREKPLGEGRGRGRGRGRPIRSESSSLGTQLSHSSSAIRAGSSGERGVQRSDAAKAYLESRRIPSYKEGEGERPRLCVSLLHTALNLLLH